MQAQKNVMYQLTLQITDSELEHSLQQIAQKEGKNPPEIALIAIQQFIQQYPVTNNDPWTNPHLDLPSIDTGITDFARNHDRYLSGTVK
jgi:hypothetical protein